MSTLIACTLSGCAVIAVADAAASLAVGTVKVVGKGVGAVVNAAIPGSDDKKPESDAKPAE